VPTPWPSWLIAAHPSQERAPTQDLRAFLEALSTYVVSFDAPDNRAGPNVEFIKETFGYREEDIGVEFIPFHCKRAHITLVDSWHTFQAWLQTVRYPQNCTVIPEKIITNTLA
jgi:hypothetical protein